MDREKSECERERGSDEGSASEANGWGEGSDKMEEGEKGKLLRSDDGVVGCRLSPFCRVSLVVPLSGVLLVLPMLLVEQMRNLRLDADPPKDEDSAEVGVHSDCDRLFSCLNMPITVIDCLRLDGRELDCFSLSGLCLLFPWLMPCNAIFLDHNSDVRGLLLDEKEEEEKERKLLKASDGLVAVAA